MEQRLQAYIDESYEAGGNYVLGGFISSPERWDLLSKEWEQALRFGTLAEGSDRYHYKHNEMTRIPERQERIPIFQKIAKKHTLITISSKINISDMIAASNRLLIPGVSIDFGPLSDPYVLAFRGLMDKFHFSREFMADVIPKNAVVDFFFDEQMGRERIIQENWTDYVNSRDPLVARLYGAMPRFLRDEDCLPLQAADMWAGTVRLALRNGGPQTIAEDYEADKGLHPWVHIDHNEDGLFEAYAEMAREYTDRIIFDVRYGESWNSFR